MTKLTKTLAAAGMMLFAGSAMALPITGSIGFTGDYDIYDNVGGSIVSSFLAGDEILINSASVTGAVTGSFADEGITTASAVSHSDIIYDPAGAISDLWSVGTFTFDLTSMTVVFKSADFIILEGNGIISSSNADLEDTAGTWNFSNNTVGANFTWSSSAGIPAPAPAITLLLGTGLIGFGVARKLRK